MRGAKPAPAIIDPAGFCFICKDEFEDPVPLSPCGCKFCKLCVVAWEATGSRACPQCHVKRKGGGYGRGAKRESKETYADTMVRNLLLFIIMPICLYAYMPICLYAYMPICLYACIHIHLYTYYTYYTCMLIYIISYAIQTLPGRKDMQTYADGNLCICI
jgi:hypothetical protein